ncbi:hypothetical protein LQW54_001045 [Pestalotiopsis sp. IQ-011]
MDKPPRDAYSRFWPCGESEILQAKEQFTGQWTTIPPQPNGDQIGDHPLVGSYSRKTNIWQIAWSMWCFLTMRYPPRPPQAQVPPHLRHLVVGQSRSAYDNILFNSPNLYTGPISYCAVLCDQRGQPGDAYAWVDDDLKQTLWECMYHNPADRPDLQTLLAQAQAKMAPGTFPAENANMRRHRRRRRRLMVVVEDREAEAELEDREAEDRVAEDREAEEAEEEEEQEVMEEEGEQEVMEEEGEEREVMEEGEAMEEAAEEEDMEEEEEDHLGRLVAYLQWQYDIAFPYGHRRIAHSVLKNESAFRSMMDSQEAQLVETYFPRPRRDQIRRDGAHQFLQLFRELNNRGRFNGLTAGGATVEERNYTMEMLCIVLGQWAHRHGRVLQLAFVFPDGTIHGSATPDVTSQPIFIYNNLVPPLSYEQCLWQGLAAKDLPSDAEVVAIDQDEDEEYMAELLGEDEDEDEDEDDDEDMEAKVDEEYLAALGVEV